MPIDGGMRDKLEPGTVLVAKYKGAEHRAEVIMGEDGKPLYRVEDGREFNSPSSAGSAVMGGVACNGWRFWSRASDQSQDGPKPKRTRRIKTQSMEMADDTSQNDAPAEVS